jgi:HEAT repeat protein
MNKLWDYEDYVIHLSHQNKLVRSWAFAAIENHFPNRYTDEVCSLIGDEVEHLACAAPKYLAKHKAIQHAPAILDSFEKSQGNIPSNCAVALGKMNYEPAVDVMLEYFSRTKSAETFLGILDYLGKIRCGNCRDALKSAVIQIQDMFILGAAATNLLQHHNPEDVQLVIDRYFDSGDRDQHYDTYLRDISYALDGAEYFSNLTEFPKNNILEKPREVIDNLILKNSTVELGDDLREDVINSLENGLFEDFSTMIMFEARSIVNARYSEHTHHDWLDQLYGQDTMSLALLEDLSKRSSIWKQIKNSKQLGSPDAGVEDLIWALKNTGSSLPKPIQTKIKQTRPISELKNALTQDLMTWGDIWTVRMMGRIGNEEFVPSLIRVLNNSDSLDYIYSDAIRAMNALEESADEFIIAAIKNKELDDWASFPILEYLPYSEAYDLALQRWEDENNDMDSYELYAGCLRGIGDPRGIEKLQYVYNNENDATYIGDYLECISIIHNVDIPEMPDILSKRKEQEERQKAREKELTELASNYRNNKKQRTLENGEKVVPFKRDLPKIGRNEPCPCGSGLKYKKCCLNKYS